jgi:hypothetical protein
MAKVKCERMTSALDYSVFNSPGQRGTAPASALFIAWTHWCGPAFTVPWHGATSLHFFLTLAGQSSPARASHLHLLSPWLICLHLHLLCSIAMVRIRGRPRRGAAWEAKKAQRRRKEKLERALTLANSILRKDARAKKLARLAIIAEPGVGCSRDVTENAPGAIQEAGFVEEFPPCIVEEEPVPEDQLIIEETRAKTHRMECRPTPTLVDDTPGCIVEEIPWPGDDKCNCHNTQEDKAGTKGAEAEAEQGRFDEGSGAAMDVGGSMHGSLIREEHLALIFDLRGHLYDLEHRALLMGQRMDMFLDAFSNVPAKRKCPLCAQAFVFLTGTTRQDGEDDKSPGI